MGIKNLNRFLRENCTKKSINKVHLKQFANKIIVIDTSIYIYRFLSDGALLENMSLLISIFKTYKITPIFVFDGKPPPEKKQLLIQRLMEKKEAEEKFLNIQSTIESVNEDEKTALLMEMDKLKRQFIRVTEDDIRKTKDLMDLHKITYFESLGEADELCACLTKSRKAWGCLSDDMDMFLYGCSYVLRNISLVHHTVLLYNTRKILKELEMTENEFCQIMVLSGTDYNIHSDTCLSETIKWFHEFKKYCFHKKFTMDFYEWLYKYTKYIRDYDNLLKTYEMFQLTNNKICNQLENIVIDKNNDVKQCQFEQGKIISVIQYV
uniref:XPG N-terminal domain-containing protein n=1 Tax=viral metagenome TaxID=1070528 RepID=A0A6C0DBX3_9ZZZZ